ncbi:hypothetical protein HDU67_006383 [Dinochytrium kinnereticum]|nr:hypothetical protein HDU67_006383 [Dinochytrium kinnereticum]
MHFSTVARWTVALACAMLYTGANVAVAAPVGLDLASPLNARAESDSLAAPAVVDQMFAAAENLDGSAHNLDRRDPKGGRGGKKKGGRGGKKAGKAVAGELAGALMEQI